MKPDDDKKVSPFLIPPPTHNGHVLMDGEAALSGEMLIKWASRWNTDKEEIAEFISDVQEAFAPHDSSDEALEKVRAVIDLEDRAVVAKHLYVKLGGDWFMAERCMWLLLGRPSCAGVENLADLNKLVGKRGYGKAAVNKCLQHFQTIVPELPILPGQREMEARLNMKKARKKQL